MVPLCILYLPYLAILERYGQKLLAPKMPYQVKQDFKNTVNVSIFLVNITDVLKTRIGRAVYSTSPSLGWTLLDINFASYIYYTLIDMSRQILLQKIILDKHATELLRIEKKSHKHT